MAIMDMESREGISMLGKGKAIEATRETLPAISIKNHVEWVNPDIDYPFTLKEGEPANLGLFLSSEVPQGESSKSIEIEPNHGRSGLLRRIIFAEKKQQDGSRQLFRDVNIKGLGNIGYHIKKLSRAVKYQVDDVKMKENGSGDSQGILNSEDAYRDMEMSETFHGYGIRTHRVVAIIALEEIINKGERISIHEAKERGLITENIKPVLEIRAFGTQARLMDAFSNLKPEGKRNLLIDDARILVAKEIREDPLKFDRMMYAKWLAKTVGKNLALMHTHGWTHGYLIQGHNITLDGCFTDFDSVEVADPWSTQGIIKDRIAALHALTQFVNHGLGWLPPEKTKEIDEILKEYETAYEQN